MIDFSFIQALEGKRVLKGYVPVDKEGKAIGKSGVTIASGVDLGQFSYKEFTDLFPAYSDSKLFNQLYDYIGFTGDEAIARLKALPLTITEDQAIMIDSVMHDKFNRELQKHWNEAFDVKFYELPDKVKTVLFSLAWNMGVNLPKVLPHTARIFVDCYVTKCWNKAYHALFHFQCKQPQLKSRRLKEAEYLKSLCMFSN